MLRRSVAVAVLILAGAVAWLWLAGQGVFGTFDGERPVSLAPHLSEDTVGARAHAIRDATGDASRSTDQILFGDLHVHTTLSGDAFFINLPLIGGAGALTPADACDFARHCAALDFWSINDHANSLYPEDWRHTVDAIRACNQRAADPTNPDVVAFLGWEWTQAGLTADTHYGHKNVVLAHTDDARIPARPIAAKFGGLPLENASPFARGALSLVEGRFRDHARRIETHGPVEACDDGPVRELPADCREVAPTPPELFRKLDDWGHDAIVIPHGTAWGIYTPPQSGWDKQLAGAMHDPARQTLIEVYSGHGDSEAYRDWRPVETDAAGNAVCPEARTDYLPICRRAGQLIQRRCLAEGEAEAECERRAEEARQFAAVAGKAGYEVVPGSEPADWLDAGQCRDCDEPSFNYVPTGSAQYIAALGNFDEDLAAPRRFRLGFMASSDNHSARPGTGYKERIEYTDGSSDDPAATARLASIAGRFLGGSEDGKPSRAVRVTPGETSPLSSVADRERIGSFQYTGGLVAVHAGGRDRGSIWEALASNASYGTSGPRILLWFDLLRDGGAMPMGSEVEQAEAPSFRVRAVGSFEQKPGCPDESSSALGADGVARLCLGECYHPSDERRPITHIDIVRIRPQVRPDELIADLVEDPWRRFECSGDPAGCEATFTDPDHVGDGRDAVYYARVYEAPRLTANGSPLRCETDADGRCTAVSLCAPGEPCLQPETPRAWSSPIYVDHPQAKRSR